ncbi:hypothetical protein ELI_2454 [Eubacterium callanderi]|uniref:Uncharacterized protein n=1 Tax=Eubacterium callanderi TaxID=53442 RepID=E3GN59_9FIRM|nr:hypothetical protein ELI_2454 [Eubacterium callanderi]
MHQRIKKQVPDTLFQNLLRENLGRVKFLSKRLYALFNRYPFPEI